MNYLLSYGAAGMGDFIATMMFLRDFEEQMPDDKLYLRFEIPYMQICSRTIHTGISMMEFSILTKSFILAGVREQMKLSKSSTMKIAHMSTLMSYIKHLTAEQELQ